MKFRQLIAIILCLLVVMTGCSRNTDNVIGYDMPSDTANLDPQFVSDRVAEMIIMNTYEGLVVRDSGGKIHAGVAYEWEISPDGLEYRFKIRDYAMWQEEETKNNPLKADDFVFAFERIFNIEAPSPHAKDYLAIENSDKVLNGELSVNQLGIEAVSDNELVIRLEHQDPLFLEKLSKPPAMPCNKEFFESTRGRYGLDIDLITGNGPFRLTRWEKGNRISMVPNENYKGEQKVSRIKVELYFARDKKIDRFLADNTDIIRISNKTAKEINVDKYSLVPYDETVWCLAFNAKSEYWSIPAFRRAMVFASDKTAMNNIISGEYTPQSSVFSDEITLGDEKVKDAMGKTNELVYNPKKAVESYAEGLSILGIERIPGGTVYIPEGAQEEFLTPLQKSWKDNLGVYISLTAVSEENHELMIKSRDYDTTVIPLKTKSSTYSSLFSQFKSDSWYDYTNYKSTAFENMLPAVEEAETKQEMAQRIALAEEFLLADAVIMPLYAEKSYYALNKTAEQCNLEIYPVDGIIRFHPVSAE